MGRHLKCNHNNSIFGDTLDALIRAAWEETNLSDKLLTSWPGPCKIHDIILLPRILKLKHLIKITCIFTYKYQTNLSLKQLYNFTKSRHKECWKAWKEIIHVLTVFLQHSKCKIFLFTLCFTHTFSIKMTLKYCLLLSDLWLICSYNTYIYVQIN